MAWTRARLRQLGYLLAAIALGMALVLIAVPATRGGGPLVEMTVVVVVLAGVAVWLILVE